MTDFPARGYLVDARELGERLGAVALLDLRPAEDFALGHIEGARHLDIYGVSLSDSSEAPLNAFLAIFRTLFGARGVSPEKPVDVATIAPLTTEFLCGVGVLDSPSDIIWAGHVDVTYAYPVYTHDRPGIIERMKAWLGRYDVYTVGRFGEWEYINSDKCVAKGLALGRELRMRYSVGGGRYV
jgi:hypothetical protein